MIAWLDSDEEFPVCLGPPAHVDTVNIEEKKGTIKVRNYFHSCIHYIITILTDGRSGCCTVVFYFKGHYIFICNQFFLLF